MRKCKTFSAVKKIGVKLKGACVVHTHTHTHTTILHNILQVLNPSRNGLQQKYTHTNKIKLINLKKLKAWE